uniref:Lipid droplet-associated hydrolase n=1 Tax=Elaeophora elaphi TaxID=1147741 RepID=A0A0R3S0V6_9BILA
METGKGIQRKVAWLQVLGRFTRVSFLGYGIKYSPTMLPSDFTGLIILMIPGNPGNEQFYDNFGQLVLSKISKISKRNSIFCTVSHLNHVSVPPEYLEINRISLADQIEHKFNFCVQYLPKTAKFILVGHSIGSYLMLKILPDLLKHELNIVRCIALFPTIERMAESPNGERLLPLLKKLRQWDCVLQMMLSWLRYLPNSVKKCICNFFMRSSKRMPPCILQGAVEIVDVNVIRNIIFMAMDELLTVSNLDESLLCYSGRCRFLYGTVDGWSPLCYGLAMQKRLGKHLVTIDDKKCEHAFVLNHGDVVAHVVANWIDECYG